MSLYVIQIAVEGCCHGSLDKIYEVLTTAEQREGCKIDLLICCGDFQVFGTVEKLGYYFTVLFSIHWVCIGRAQ